MLRYAEAPKLQFVMTTEEYEVARENWIRENPVHKLRWPPGAFSVFPGAISWGFSIKIPFPEYSTLGKIWMSMP